MRYALTVVEGLLAMARCQYAWSWKTVAKFPIRLITPNMRPFLERRVRYEPPALPATGETWDASESRSCIFSMEPMDPELAYTVKVNVNMMAKRTVVCVLKR